MRRPSPTIPAFWDTVRTTAIFVVFDVSATILAALGLACCCFGRVRARRLLRTVLILPFAMSPALIGISWRFMFNPEYGAFQHGIGAILPFMRDADWFASPGLARAALISADVWHWTPYFTFMLMGGLASIPPETQEAARIDGSGAWRVFRDVTLPQLAPVLGVAVILKSVFALKVFDSSRDDDRRRAGHQHEHAVLLRLSDRLPRLRDGLCRRGVSYLLTAVLVVLSLLYMRMVFRR